MKEKPISQNGFNKLLTELELIKQQYSKLNELIDDVKREGDLSDNSTYLNALEEQQILSSKIRRLIEYRDNAKIIDNSKSKSLKIIFNKPFKILNLEENTTFKYSIVGEYEADPTSGLISINSPLAKQCLGKEKGEEIKVLLKNDSIFYEILEV